jgi:hypothetical protein
MQIAHMPDSQVIQLTVGMLRQDRERTINIAIARYKKEVAPNEKHEWIDAKEWRAKYKKTHAIQSYMVAADTTGKIFRKTATGRVQVNETEYLKKFR